MKPIRETCILRPEVLKGDLQDALFAADFGHVIEGRAAMVYQDAETFFRNTHPAAPLKKVVTTIFERLASHDEAGAAIRLSTGFGGGKTHTLIALWHLAQNISFSTLGTELLSSAGRPKTIAVAGVDGEKLGATICRRHDEGITHSLWAELAFQLGGEAGYADVRSVDNPEKAPDAALIRDILPSDKPVLILLDEVVSYMAKLTEQGRRSLLEFIRALISEILARKQAVIVITDPAGQPSYQREAEMLAAEVVNQSVQELDGVLGRKMSDFDPIGDESAQVIVRRLFERVNKETAEEIAAEYFNAYQRVAAEYPDMLPAEATRRNYAQRIVTCYPFHPRLLETATNRLGALQDFQKSRGTLRLFARILRDLWESGSDAPLITAGDLDWASERIQSDLLQRLNRDHFKAAVDADVVRHAIQLDEDFSTDVHRRVASALLLESLPLTSSAVMDKRDITLAVLRPSDVGHEPGEAIDRLMRFCWHTYKDSSGRFQFRYEPNVNKLIEEFALNLPIEDARQAVRTLAQNYFKGHTFELIAYPGSPRAVSDSAKLKLVLCETEQLAQDICDYEDNSNPEALRPRHFRNAIFGIAPTLAMFEQAARVRRELTAAEEVEREQRRITREQGRKTPLLQQVEELLPPLRKRAQLQAIRSFNRVMFQGRGSITLEEKYLVSEDSALSGSVNGQAKLKEMLDDKKLIYQPNDALDIGLLRDLIKGATPSLDHDGAYPASAVVERALSHERLRLMLNENPVRNAILKAVERGELVVRNDNGDVYDDKGCLCVGVLKASISRSIDEHKAQSVTGAEGKRNRIESQKLTTLKLTADVLIALPDAACVADWLKEDSGDGTEQLINIVEAASIKYTSPEIVNNAIHEELVDYKIRDGEKLIVNNKRFQQWQPTAPPGEVIAYTWEEAINYADKRPLMEMTLKTKHTDNANKLLACAQPFGAKSLTLSVIASGELKDGGMVNFAANNLKVNSPLKPIDMATRMLRAATDDAKFEASLVMKFDEGVNDTAPKFEQARDIALTGVDVSAKFGKEN